MGVDVVEENSRLRDAITKALKANMKRDTIDSAIKRGAGGLEGSNMIEMRYEGYGPGGVAILVDCLSDNKNRTVSDVRHTFHKYGGNLGTDGSVAYLFSQQGEILLAPTVNEEAAIELAIDNDALDVIQEEGQVEIMTLAENYHAMLSVLAAEHFEIEHSRLTMHAQTKVPLDEGGIESLEQLIDALEDLDDVQSVYSNAQYPDN